MLKSLSLLALISLMPFSAWSQSYQLGEATFAGSGCPQGTAVATVSPDGSSISFLFDAFKGEYLQRNDRSKTTAQCSIRVPVQVQDGYMVQATYIDLRGFTEVPASTFLRITASGLAGNGRIFGRFSSQSTVNGPYSGDFFKRQAVQQIASESRKCHDVNEIQINLHAQILGRNAGGMFTLDSGDIGSDGVTVGVAIVPCRKVQDNRGGHRVIDRWGR